MYQQIKIGNMDEQIHSINNMDEQIHIQWKMLTNKYIYFMKNINK